MGDAFKEFSIRMNDGTANDYLSSLGLNADEVVTISTAKVAICGSISESPFTRFPRASPKLCAICPMSPPAAA